MSKHALGAVDGGGFELPNGNGGPSDSQTWSPMEVQNVIERDGVVAGDPVLVVDVTDIKDRRKGLKKDDASREPASKKVRPPHSEALCSLTIWPSDSKGAENLVEMERRCKVYPKILPNGERGASISLDETFKIPVASLRSRNETTTEVIKGQSYSVQLMLWTDNVDTPWPPIDTRRSAPKQPVSHDGGRVTRLPVFIAKWKNLPQIPETPEKALLEVVTAQDDMQLKSILSMKIDMTWRSISHQPDPELSRITKRPSPAATPELRGKTRHLQWTFVGELEPTRTSVKVAENHCALCYHKGKDDVVRLKQFQSLERLFFHAMNDHPLYKFWYSPTAKDASFLGEFEVTPSGDSQVITPRDPDMREMEWVRPEESFDLKPYLDGDETWAGKKHKKSNGTPASRNRRDESTPKQQERAKTVLVAPARVRAPEEVPDVIPRVRRKFKVPKAPPGVKFYREPSMRPVKEGELLSETDEEVDEEWLLQKHADNVDSFCDIPSTEKELIKAFDRHMAKENFSSDLHAAEALYRFCKQHRKLLQRRDILRDFNALLVARKETGSIGLEQIYHCNMIVRQPIKEDEMDVDQVEEGDKRAKYANFGDVPPEGAHPYGRCAICQQIIYGTATAISCTEPLCKRPVHHLFCASLASRPPNWRCKPCETGISESTPTAAKTLADAAGSTSHAPSRSHDLPMRTPTKIPPAPPSTEHPRSLREAWLAKGKNRSARKEVPPKPFVPKEKLALSPRLRLSAPRRPTPPKPTGAKTTPSGAPQENGNPRRGDDDEEALVETEEESDDNDEEEEEEEDAYDPTDEEDGDEDEESGTSSASDGADSDFNEGEYKVWRGALRST